MIGTTRLAFAVALLMGSAAQLGAQSSRLDVRVDVGEAEAALTILERGAPAVAADWQKLFASEGYLRLKQRELAMHRPFTDSAFRVFLLDSATMRKAQAWRGALDAWRAIDPQQAAARAFRYLPDNARIRATIYPVIKPATNTFVFEPATNPAIFFYLDPTITRDKFDNTLAHELHHLGVGSVCHNDSLPLAQQWMSGFAEGRAVLAAAGSPDVHPHATSDAAERAVWDRDFRNVAADMRRMEVFFTDLMDGRLSEAEQNRRGMSFVNTDTIPQGAFYTVGYMMARAIEKNLGRARLVASLCEPVMFLSDYNRVAAMRGMPRWSSGFMERLLR